MGVVFQQAGGFIPQTTIQITDTRANTILSNIKIERKVGSGNFVTLLQTDTDNNKFIFNDINDFGKVYEYKVSYEVYQRQAYTNSTTNKKNFWTENFNLGNLKVANDGALYGTGTATAKQAYLDRMNQNGTASLNLTGYIGTGGDGLGYNGGYKKVTKNNKVTYKQLDKNTYDNLIFYFDYGTTYNARSMFITKAWSNAKAWDKRFAVFLNKRDTDNKRNQIRMNNNSKESFYIYLFFKKSGNAYNYGFKKGMLHLGADNGLSTRGGKCTRFRIALKNNAKLIPNFETTVTSGTMYKYVKLGNTQVVTKRIIVKDEPDIDYGIFVNEYGEGFRFDKWDSNGLISNSPYETVSTTQMLELQDSNLPIPYVNDNRKTPSIDFKILVDNIAYRNRIRERVLTQNYCYLFVPKTWKYQINTGFYAYEKCIETRLDENIYEFEFTGARLVLGSVSEPPKWTFGRLRTVERNYITTMENYKDFKDLAISPLGNEILGIDESDWSNK